MKQKRLLQFSYLLRLWSVPTDSEPLWRASLENIVTGQRHGFSDLEALLGYLFHLIEKSDTIGHSTTENSGTHEIEGRDGH
jgi:hypothetical protein